MAKKPTYEELEQRVKELEKEAVEHNRVEENLQLQSQVAENMAEGVYLIRTSDGTIVYANKTFEGMFGYDPGELVNKHVSTVNVPTEKSSQEIADEIIQSLKEKGSWSGEVENIKKDGTPFWCHATVSTYDHHDFGEVWVAVHEDITERKRAEEQLYRAEQEKKAILDSMLDFVVYQDLDQRVVWANRVAAEAVGMTPEQIMGHYCYQIWNGRTEPCEGCPVTKALKTGQSGNMELPGPDDRMLLIRGYPVKDQSGSIVGAVEGATDITDRKQAEEQIKISLKEKEVLLREVHHRVKNNFQIISGFLDMIKMRTRNQEAIDLLTSARSKIHTMALVHTQLYEQERFDRVDMGRHIRKLVDYLSQTYGGRGKSIHTMIEASDVYLEISQAIPCALVLNEVISNAFKHAFRQRQRGTIEISIRGTDDDMVVIRVKDDGIGIPEEVDIDKTNTLGLKLVKNLVQSQLKGKPQVQRDNGTEIIVQFRLSKQEEKHA